MWIGISLTEPVQEQTHRAVQTTQPLSLPSHEPSWNYPCLVPSNYSFHFFFFCWSWRWLMIGSVPLLVFCLLWSCFFFGILFVYDTDDSCNHTAANQEATRVNKLTSDYEHIGAYMFSSLSWSWWSRFVLSMLAVICFCSRIILKLRLYIARDWYSASSASESEEFSLCILSEWCWFVENAFWRGRFGICCLNGWYFRAKVLSLYTYGCCPIEQFLGLAITSWE